MRPRNGLAGSGPFVKEYGVKAGETPEAVLG
jgi:hypothetical protein